jgi:hypothetical protein
LVLRRKVLFTAKAEDEMDRDDLDKEDVYESILNAPAITKRLRSANPKSGKREHLYVLVGITFDGIVIYTKGKIHREGGREVFYVLISSKKSTS